MTIESGRTEELSGTELIESMASTSADLWNEVLQRLNEVQEGHTRLTEAVDHLGEVVSGALALEPEEDRDLSLGPGIATVVASTEVARDVGGSSLDASTAVRPGGTVEETPEVETGVSSSPGPTSDREQRWLTEAAAPHGLSQKTEVEDERPWLAEPVAVEAPSHAREPEAEEARAQAPEAEKTETTAAPELGVVTEEAEPEPTVTEPTVTEPTVTGATATEAGEQEAPTATAAAEPTIPEPEVVAETPEATHVSETAAEPAIPEPEVAPAPEVAAVPWLAAEPAIPEPEVAPAPEVAAVPWLAAEPAIPESEVASAPETGSVSEVTAVAQPTVGLAGAGIDTAGAATAAPGGTGAVPGPRVLDPRQVLDLTPELLDAVLAAEFGGAGDDARGPEALNVQALLDAEFKPAGRVATTPNVPPLVPPTSIESDLPPLPSRALPNPPSAPLPPPPSNLLPPPPKPEVAVAVRPTPLGNIGTNEPGAVVQPTSSPPQAVEAPPAEVSGLGTPPPIPEASSPGSGSEVPPLSFGSPGITGEPTLPAQPPPIPEPAPSADSGGTQAPARPIEAPGHVEAAEPELPPLSFDETPFVASPSLPSEPPPIPQAASTARDKEDRVRVDPEAYVAASSMATEILAVRSPEGSQPPAEQEGTTAAAEQPASNVVSQDFTIISKKHKRFRLR